MIRMRRFFAAGALGATCAAACMVTIDDVRESPVSEGGAPPDSPMDVLDVANDVVDDQPKPGDCALDMPAFCEQFNAPAPPSDQSRGGDVDVVRWSVARVSNDVNSGGNNYLQWFAPQVAPCGRSVPVDAPEKALAVCTGTSGDSHLEETVSKGPYSFLSLRARQPFDFAGRNGIIAFDVDTSGGADNWVEVWITKQPSAGAWADHPVPENALGFQFFADQCVDPAGQKGFNELDVVTNYAIARKSASDGPCFATQPGKLSHVVIEIGPSRIAVSASDAGNPGSLRVLKEMIGTALPLTRGYVQFEHFSRATSSIVQWDNLGFDGPRLPRPRGFDVRNSRAPLSSNSVSLGYGLSEEPRRLEVFNVRTSGARKAYLDMDGWFLLPGSSLSYRLNIDDGGYNWHDVTVPDMGTQDAHGAHADLLFDELREGTNQLDLKATSADGGLPVVVANIGITLE